MADRPATAPEYAAADLYGEMWLAEPPPVAQDKTRASRYFSGLAITATAAAAATMVADRYGMPAILAGLLIGLALNFVSGVPGTRAGFQLCSTTFLRWGIVLLGTQITLMQISELGLMAFLALVLIMSLVILAGYGAARVSGQGTMVGLLAGGATAICGASAALAIYSVIGQERLEYHRFTFTLVGITLASAVAMSAYPILAEAFAFTDRQAGFLMGAAIHDVAQSLGAGFNFSHAAGETATIVKLTRVTLLAPVVAVIGILIGPVAGKASGAKRLRDYIRLPWFIVAFFIVVGVNSLIAMPPVVAGYGLIASKTLLLLAVIATAMNSRLDAVLSEGMRGVIPVVAATLTSFVATVLFAWQFL